MLLEDGEPKEPEFVGVQNVCGLVGAGPILKFRSERCSGGGVLSALALLRNPRMRPSQRNRQGGDQ